MFLYHYFDRPMFAVAFVCPIHTDDTEGFLPRLAFGLFDKDRKGTVALFGASLHSAKVPMFIRHTVRVSLSELVSFPPNSSSG